MIDLVTDVGPDNNFAGGQVLERLIRYTPTAEFAVHIVDQGHLVPPTPLVGNWRMATHQFVGESKFEQRAKRALGKLFSFWPSIGKAVGIAISSVILLSRGLRLAIRLSRSKSDVCWLVLQGQRIVILYVPVFLLVRKKIVLHQWDPIDWWLQHQGAGKRTIAVFEKIVTWMCRHADLNIVPSDRWKFAIEQLGGRAIRVDNFFEDHEIVHGSKPRLFPNTEVHSVFVGQLYAQAELTQLIRAFATAAQKSGRRPILHYYGAAAIPSEWSFVETVVHGFVSRDRLLEELGQYDFGLLPYPRSAQHDTTARFSFPSKSRVYVASGLPILSNCDVSSSPHEFYAPVLGRWYANVSESSDVGEFLERSMAPENRDEIRRFCGQVAKSSFSSTIELSKFQSAMEKKP